MALMKLIQLLLPDFAEKETLNFNSLPWVCQKRFAEICDPETLKTFASINESTRSLSKRCHIIRQAEVIQWYQSSYKFHISCFCKDEEFCNGINEADLFKKKPEPMDEIVFVGAHKEITYVNAAFLRCLPFGFASVKRLRFHCCKTDLDILTKLITPQLKHLHFGSKILSNDTEVEFVEFISKLAKLDTFRINMFRPHTSPDFIQRCLALPFPKCINGVIFECDEYFVTLSKR